MHKETENSVNIEKKVVLIGVGGGGMNTLEELRRRDVPATQFIAVNRDQASLKKSEVQEQIYLEAPKNSEASLAKAVKQQEIAIGKLLDGMDALVLVAGMGGMTGSYASPEITRIAKKTGLKTWAVVTTPFDFEGSRRSTDAQTGIEHITRNADAVICVNNQDLIKASEKNMPMRDAFKRVDALAAEVIAMIIEHGKVTEDMLQQLPVKCSLLKDQCVEMMAEEID